LVWAAVKGAYVAVKSADKENRKPLSDLFAEGAREDLAEVSEFVASEVGTAFDESLRESLTQSDAKRLLKEKLARVIAKRVRVTAPVFPTVEERDRKRMEELEAKATELRNRYNA
jgi:predicted HAD superfamily phosphohydrolase